MNLIEQYRDIPITSESLNASYELFLKSIDDLSVARLKSIDIIFNVLKHQFADQGFELTELECVSPTVKIKRNQFGFYVDETRSLNSKEEYKNYEYGKKFFKKHEDEFKRLNQLLTEKEIIMRGCYKIKNETEESLYKLAKSLGYCTIRDALLYEMEPKHPSDEYKRLLTLLELCDSNKVHDFRPIINQALDMLRKYFKKDITLEIKRLKDKYDMTFDNSYGILLIDKKLGEMNMLYYFDGIKITKISYEKYLDEDNPYLEIYMRIILKCLKREMSLNSKMHEKK